jgi:hypothetical protein
MAVVSRLGSTSGGSQTSGRSHGGNGYRDSDRAGVLLAITRFICLITLHGGRIASAVRPNWYRENQVIYVTKRTRVFHQIGRTKRAKPIRQQRTVENWRAKNPFIEDFFLLNLLIFVVIW